ncbi:unnamed protein product (macronuclear) [Paramecium tetraurelia]|uniref:CBF1-interacting co-repressor CIR N-terminal domain-containing protein n=1 Tax=Paramecium tetraurelia TaxID=5888 RepID=A0CT76_PARTE|nr:uncharacterized protein GSPATT00010227001 [Paramecium tetraurelia]CAK73993.1 unnamed protein product [Paramecium tetraurelia]|eukprot:XP_001441390.1 hypothetical protein (macronuclear) [Paramecium tetraurelia strain d4-2]
MGGHGGLNILPQKKWNVYNMENRNIVERDKRKERERVQKEKRKEHKEQAGNRIQKLKQQRRAASHTPSRSVSESQSRSRSRSQSQKKQGSSKVNAELREILEAKQHINLFKEEEQYLLQKENNQAKIELEKEFFKDKPFDLSTKFLGQYDQTKPWYIQQRQDQKQTQLQQNVKQQLKNFKEKKDNYYQILDLSKKYQEETLVSQIDAKKEETIKDKKEEENDPAYIKEMKKKQKKYQKLGEQIRELLGSDDSEIEKIRQKQKQREREKLKKERLQREKVERSREQKLLSSIYEFKQK